MVGDDFTLLVSRRASITVLSTFGVAGEACLFDESGDGNVGGKA